VRGGENGNEKDVGKKKGKTEAAKSRLREKLRGNNNEEKLHRGSATTMRVTREPRRGRRKKTG